MLVNNEQDLLKLIPELSNLCSLSFKNKISDNYLKWRYIDNPSDDILFNVEFNEEGKLISSYSCFPVRLIIDEVVVNSMMSMSTMTHPDYCGKGLFTKLAKGLFDYAKECDYVGVWGFPNLNSHYGFVNKLGWNDIYEIPTLGFSVNTSSACDNCDFDNGFALDGYDNIQTEGNVKLFKNIEYLKWRYADNPINRYDVIVEKVDGIVKGYVVLKKYVSQSTTYNDLVDYGFCDDNIMDLLIDKVIAYSSCEPVLLWASVCSRFRKGLERKRGLTYHHGVQYFSGYFWNDKIKTFYDYRNWNIVMGDSDVY